MSLFAEFGVPADSFALSETLRAVPDLVIEIERVVATGEILTPYFWVSGASLAAFEDAARADPTIENLRRLDEFDEATLYRGEWTENVETLVFVSTEIGAVILEATSGASRWVLRVRFDEREDLDRFVDYCNEREVSFDLQCLYEITHPRVGAQYGLTPKQHEALVTAWEMGYFSLPREADLSEVAAALDISQQALSDRLRRGHDALVANTLRVTSATEAGY
ncbi:MAG: bacterio-opsin activator domain-containing protein [Salinigranum sp.]